MACSVAYAGSPSIGGMWGFSKLSASFSAEGSAMMGGERNNQQPTIIN